MILSGNWGNSLISFTISSLRISMLSAWTSEKGMVIRAMVSPFSTSMSKESSSKPIFFSIRTRITIPSPAPSVSSITVERASSIVKGAGPGNTVVYPHLLFARYLGVVFDAQSEGLLLYLKNYLDIEAGFFLFLQIMVDIRQSIFLKTV